MSLGCLHLNAGGEFKRFLYKNLLKYRFTDWTTSNKNRVNSDV
ncbi:MAG: hypothetical protein QOH35_1271 [Acidobacteriaceae bacterium]|jgi:hypothetical protein|nr:hypothetical protein [Acidobacteriaceae bacterium]